MKHIVYLQILFIKEKEVNFKTHIIHGLKKKLLSLNIKKFRKNIL